MKKRIDFISEKVRTDVLKEFENLNHVHITVSVRAIPKAKQIFGGEPYWHQRNHKQVEDSEYNDDKEIFKNWFEFSTLSY